MSTDGINKDDHDRSVELLALLWTFTILALMIVTFKLYTRIKIIRQTGFDDALIFISMLLILTCTIIYTVAVQYGMGRHTYYLSFDDAMKAAKLNYIANPFGVMAYSFPNIAVAIFIDRLLVMRRWKRFGIYALVILQVLAAAISCILIFTQCTPAESLWDPQLKARSCLPTHLLTNFSYFVGSYTAFTDIVLAAVPVWTFHKLQMARKAKIATSIIMSMTLAAAVCAIVKTTKLYELADIEDFTYGTVDLIITAVVEANVIIIAASVPTLRPFVITIGHTLSQSSLVRKIKDSATTSQTGSIRNSWRWFKLTSLDASQALASSNFDGKTLTNGTKVDDVEKGITKTTDVEVTHDHTQTGRQD